MLRFLKNNQRRPFWHMRLFYFSLAEFLGNFRIDQRKTTGFFEKNYGCWWLNFTLCGKIKASEIIESQEEKPVSTIGETAICPELFTNDLTKGKTA